MKDKILKIEMNLPGQTRFLHETYYDLITKIKVSGGNPWSVGDLRILFDDLEDVRIVTKSGDITYFYEDEVIRFDFYAGFAHNTSSVPSIFKPIVDNDSFKMAVAALPHDGIYTGHQMQKSEADKLFVDTIEYFHDKNGEEGFWENIKEDIIEKGIEIAFNTDQAMKSWTQGAELASKSGSMMIVKRVNT